jgi:deferrochelatase/peroxidase EfeB
MAARADCLRDTGAAGPEHWDDGLRAGDVHVLVTISGRDANAVGRSAGRVRAQMTDNGFAPGLELPAAQLSEQREHFGFTDGLGQPAIAGVAREHVPGQGVPIRRRPWTRPRGDILPSADRRIAWRPLRPGEFVLGYDDEDGGPPPPPAPPLHRNGTFMVWRKLHQDVAGFRAFLGEAAGRTGLAPDLVAAKLLGRLPDGSPLALRPHRGDERLGNDRGRVNDFGYAADPDGFACPRGAHVRRANPRDALRHGGRLTARHRILRRGMPYGEPLSDGAPDDGADRGLVFVCLQASIRAPVRDRAGPLAQRRRRIRPRPRPRSCRGRGPGPWRPRDVRRPATAVRDRLPRVRHPARRRVPLRARHRRPPRARRLLNTAPNTLGDRGNTVHRDVTPSGQSDRDGPLGSSDTKEA